MLSGLFNINSFGQVHFNIRSLWLILIVTTFYSNSCLKCKEYRPWSGSTLFANVHFYVIQGINGFIVLKLWSEHKFHMKICMGQCLIKNWNGVMHGSCFLHIITWCFITTIFMKISSNSFLKLWSWHRSHRKMLQKHLFLLRTIIELPFLFSAHHLMFYIYMKLRVTPFNSFEVREWTLFVTGHQTDRQMVMAKRTCIPTRCGEGINTDCKFDGMPLHIFMFYDYDIGPPTPSHPLRIGIRYSAPCAHHMQMTYNKFGWNLCHSKGESKWTKGISKIWPFGPWLRPQALGLESI